VPGSFPLLIVVACALLDGQGRVLLGKRPEGKHLAGLWEFPGGKVEAGETPEVALRRELLEEIGIDVSEVELIPLSFVSHRYAHFHLLMPLYVCHSWLGEIQSGEGQLLQWVAVKELDLYLMPPADRPLVKALQNFLRKAG